MPLKLCVVMSPCYGGLDLILTTFLATLGIQKVAVIDWYYVTVTSSNGRPISSSGQMATSNVDRR